MQIDGNKYEFTEPIQMPINTPYEEAIGLSSKDNLKRGNASVVIQHTNNDSLNNQNKNTTNQLNKTCDISNDMKNLNV